MSPPEVNQEQGFDHKWVILGTISVGILLATIDGSIVNVALPTLVDDLGTTFNVIQWVGLGYILTIATLTLGMGRLGDVVGKKWIYTAGFLVFTIASAACGLAPRVSWLIGFRVVQAIGAVMILALGSAILVEAFPSRERGKALGWIMSAVSFGIIIGPVLGGLLISAFSWHAIFLVNIPVGIAGTWMAIKYVPRTRPAAGQKFDLLGATLMSASLFCLSLALTLGQEAGFASTPILALFGASLTTATAFVIVELRVEHPMLQLRLFKSVMLTVGVVTGVLVFVCLSAVFLLLPFYLSGVLGWSVLRMGLLLGVAPVMMGIVSPLSGTLSDRIGVRRLTLGGLTVIALSYVGFLTLTTETTAIHFVALAIPYGIGIGIFQSPNNSAIMGSVPAEYMGVGGGLLNLTRLLGQIVGIAVLGSIWATLVAKADGGSLPSGGATAAGAAAQLSGLHGTLLIAIGIMVVAMGFGVWGLREEQRSSNQPSALSVSQ
ncbi:MAG: DHA2 family efflux MFS transporter permease subunit [Acidimicrobiia bacterium]